MLYYPCMIIKGALAQKIIQRTGLGHNPGHIREQIRHANANKETRKKLEQRYEQLRLGKPIIKGDLKKFLAVVADKKVVDLHGTYLHTIAHNPEKVITWAQHTVKAEGYERRQEQMHVEEKQLDTLEHKKEEEEKKKRKKEAEALAHAPVGVTHGNTPQMKDGKAPLPKHIKAT